MKLSNLNPSPELRAWLYGIAVAAFAVAGAYGLVTEELAVVWLALVAAVLNGMALGNTPAGRHRESDDDRIS